MSYKTETAGWLRFMFRNSSGYLVAHLGSVARYGFYMNGSMLITPGYLYAIQAATDHTREGVEATACSPLRRVR